MACIKLVYNRTFWIIIILLNKNFIQTAMPIQISENRSTLKHDPAHESGKDTLLPDRMNSNSMTRSDITVNDRVDANSMTRSVKDVTVNDRIDANSVTRSVKDITVNDQMATNSITRSVKDITVNDQMDANSVTRSVKDITVNDQMATNSMTRSVKDITVNDQMDANSVTRSVKDITVNDQMDAISMTRYVKDITVNDQMDANSMTRSVKDITVNDQMATNSMTRYVKDITVNDQMDANSMIRSVKDITVNDRVDANSMTRSVKDITVNDQMDANSMTRSVQDITVNDQMDANSVTRSVKDITVNDQMDANSMTRSVKDITVNDQMATNSMTRYVKDITVNDQMDANSMTRSVKDITVNYRVDANSVTRSVKDITVNDQMDANSMTRSVKDITVNEQMDANSMTRYVKDITVNDRVDANSMTRSVKDITVNDQMDANSMTRSVKDITVNDQMDANSVTRSVKDITVNDRVDANSMTRSVKDITVNDQMDANSMTRSVKDITVNDQMDANSKTRSVKDITVNDQMDANSVTRSVKDITVNDRVDANSVTRSVKAITVNDQMATISMTRSVKDITVNDQMDANSMTRSVKDITVNDQMDANSMTRSVKAFTVNNQMDVNSVARSVKDITVNGQTDANSMTRSAKDITVNDQTDTNSVTRSAKHIIMNDVTSPSILLTFPLKLLYHMIWCIQVKLVHDPPVSPYDDQYKNCRSPFLSNRSIVMYFAPHQLWLNNYKDTQVTVAQSLLSDIVWCSLHEFTSDFMLFSFDNLLKLCEKTKQVAETFRFDRSGVSVKLDMKNKYTVILRTILLYHIIWCVQNESLHFNGLPIYDSEVKSCTSPLYPFNNAPIQGTKVEWWGTPDSLKYSMNLLVYIIVDILKCAEKKVFGPDDMSHPYNILRACEATKRTELLDSVEVKRKLQRKDREGKRLNAMRPAYICVGLLALIVGSLGNFLTLVIAMRKRMRQTSTGIYLSFLSILDTVFLYVRIIPQLLVYLNAPSRGLSGEFGCKITSFFVFYVDHLSAWIRLCFTTERMFAVTLPYIYRAHFTRIITVIILLTCSVILAGVNSFSLVLIRRDGKTCRFARTFYIFKWVDVVVSTIIPFLGIFLSNSIMLYSLWHANRQRQHMTNWQSNVHKISILCLSSSFCFVLSAAPIRIYLLAENSGLYYSAENSNVRLDISIGLHMCRLLNSSIGFLVYWLGGSLFREEMAKLLKRETTVSD